MQEIVYLKLDEKIQTENPRVKIGDIVKITCRTPDIAEKIAEIPLFNFEDKKDKRQVITLMKIIEQIHEKYPYPRIQVIPIGETATVAEYTQKNKAGKLPDILKIIFVSGISFFGTAFTIMAFHNDIDVKGIFANIYFLIMGREAQGITLFEIMYSLGLAVGIIVFFNHIGGRRITKDPTPIEVAMCTYEDDVNATLVENWEREGKAVDVP